MKWCAPQHCRRLEGRPRPPACSRSRTMVHSCFDPLLAVGEFSCTRIGWPMNTSGSGARPDNASFQGKLAPGWPINRQVNRDAARIVVPGRIEIVPASGLAGSCRDVETLLRMITAPPSQGARFDRRGAAAPQTTAANCRRSPIGGSRGARGATLPMDSSTQPVPAPASALERLPYTWNHVIEKESLKFKELEHVLIEKVDQLFRDMLVTRCPPPGIRSGQTKRRGRSNSNSARHP